MWTWTAIDPETKLLIALTDTLHDMEWLAQLIEEEWPKPNRPKTYRKN